MKDAQKAAAAQLTQPEEDTGTRRFAFVKRGRFSYCNPRFLEAFQKVMQPCEVRVLDTWEELVSPRDLRNVLDAVRDYAPQIARAQWTLRDCMSRSPRNFHRLRGLIRKKLAGGQWDFTFQMQSLFDASLPGVPHFVYTDHTHLTNLYYPSFDQENLFPEKWIACEREIYQNARMVFTMGSHVAQSLVEHYGLPEDRVQHIYQGSNVNVAEDFASEPGRYANRRIVFVGIDWERKGGPQLLQAFEQVLAKVPDAQLTIVGCSPPVTLPNVEVAGLVPPEEVARQYARAAIYVMPTRIEPAGAACNEAMLYRLPVVASRVGALPDRVQEGQTGYLVDPDDVQGFADRLVELLLDPGKAERFGQAGYQFARTTYTWDHSARLAREAILRCLDQ